MHDPWLLYKRGSGTIKLLTICYSFLLRLLFDCTVEMAEYGEQCVDQTRRTDEYGNPVRQAAGGITGEYGATGGNVGEFGTTGEYGNKGGGIGAGTTDGASLTGEYQGQLRRSGSGSSVSSTCLLLNIIKLLWDESY